MSNSLIATAGQYMRYFGGEGKDKARTCLSKRYLPKLMVLAIVARPNPLYRWSGKVALIRCAEKKFRSRNYNGKYTQYEAGDEYTEDVTVNSDRYKRWVRSKVFPAIRKKMWWPVPVVRRRRRFRRYE